MRADFLTVIGATLIICGIVAFTYRGIPYGSNETVTAAPTLSVSVDRRKTIPMSPLLIGLVFVAGATLLAVGSAKSSRRPAIR